jgi:hypothetical protein
VITDEKYQDLAVERDALDAELVFEKVRCDDRTDRWQVANEIAAAIRARKGGA